MPEPLVPATGWGVLHLFCKSGPLAESEAVVGAVKAAQADGVQVVAAAMLGHKADVAFMALGPDLWRLRQLQTELTVAGLDVVDSYVSLTELSEYAQGVPDEMKEARLHPQLPPEGKAAFCFYPMSKRRGDTSNWFTLPYDDRKELMYAHGASGRKFAGRVLQVITGSTGIDDFEWGVTLFAVHPDDLKEVVYTMRFDEASALYAEFGPFYTGMVAPLPEVLRGRPDVTAPQPRNLYRPAIVAPDRRTLHLLFAFLLAVVVLLGASSASGAQEPSGDEREIRVNVVDRKGTPDRGDDEPVEGAVIVVTDASDEEVDEVETDAEGKATITLPGEGQYTATLDLDSLEDDTGLPHAGGEVVPIDPNRSRVLNFTLGDRERSTTSTLDRIPQKLFDGLGFGLIIAITSVGLSLIFGTTGLVNFSHGEHVTFGAMVAWWINVELGIHLIPAGLLAIGIGAAAGALVDRVLWKRLRTRGMSLVAMMIVSIGLSLSVRSFLQLLFGGVYRPYNQYNVKEGIDIGPIRASAEDLWIIVIVLVVIVAVASLLQFSLIGKAMRAVSDNPDLAASSGIDVDRVILFVWAVGGGLAALLGGILFGVQQQVQFEMGFRLLLLMFAGITLGGLGTAYGALVGSFVVGMFIEMSTLVIPTELKNVGALAVLIVVLLVRPQGILGRAERIG